MRRVEPLEEARVGDASVQVAIRLQLHVVRGWGWAEEMPRSRPGFPRHSLSGAARGRRKIMVSWWQRPSSVGVAVWFSQLIHLLPERWGRDDFFPIIQTFPSSLLAI